MSGIGFTEILLLGLIGLIVLGPRRLPEIARMLGHWTGRARAAWNSLRQEIQSEMDAEHNRKILEAAKKARADLEKLARDRGEIVREEVDKQTGEQGENGDASGSRKRD